MRDIGRLLGGLFGRLPIGRSPPLMLKTVASGLKLPRTTFARVGLTAQTHDVLGEFKGRAMDPILTARYGMMAAARQVEQSAQRVAGRGAMADLASEAIEQASARHRFQRQSRRLEDRRRDAG